ncbi:MAG: hypothetical protein SGJ02_08995 [bacterium]|nr:hypothetical protein [bacterium]
MYRTFYKTILLASIFFCVSIPIGLSAQARTDFDGDEISDILYTSTVLTEISWRSAPSASGATAINENFGLSKDVSIPGYWKLSSVPALATVRISGDSLVWRLLDQGGEDLSQKKNQD